MKKWRRPEWVTLCALWMAGYVGLAAPVPPGTLGIARLGTAASPESDRAFRLLEGRIQRWLENRGTGDTLVKPIGGPIPEEELAREAVRLGLVRALERARESLKEPSPALALEEALGSLSSLVAQGESLGLGPEVQQYWLLRGLMSWLRGQGEQSLRHLKRAVAWHPEGRLPDVALPRSAGEGSDWVSQKRAAAAQTRRDCGWLLRELPAGASLRVNGFPAAGERLALGSGVAHRVEVESKGLRWVRGLTCDRPARGVWRVQSDPRTRVIEGRGLAEWARRQGVGSLWLVEQQGERFRFFLYTPGVAVDEIPLVGRLAVRQVLNDPFSEGIPVLSDALEPLLRRHQSAAASWGAGGAASGQTVGNRRDSDKWYNDWKFWALASGVVGGALITFFAVRGNSVQSQPHKGIRVRID